MAGPDIEDELITLRDWLRYAVSRFGEAKLVYGHGTERALDEAAFLILHTLHLPIDELEPYLDARLTRAERSRVKDIVEKRVVTRKPAPYLTNEAWMLGHSFYVDERVIVPRSYIGELLETGLEGIVEDPEGVTRILDLCTGSGCLAILAALAFPNATVDAVDISPDALAVAARNVADYGLGESIRLVQSDLFAGLAGCRYDLILSNPPYVDREGMDDLPPEYRHEPRLALDGGGDGLAAISRILDDVPAHLEPGGVLVMEIGRGREQLEALIEHKSSELLLNWIETETSSNEVFWTDFRA